MKHIFILNVDDTRNSERISLYRRMKILNKKRSLYYFAPYNGWNNQQLVKNCGALALIFHEKYGFNSVMVGGKNGTYNNLDKYLHGVQMDFLPSCDINTKLQYIRNNFKKIDLLVVHNHFSEIVCIVNEYRKYRPDGKVYLEADTNYQFQDSLSLKIEENIRFLFQCDVVGISCRKLQKFLSNKWPCVVDYIPNGFYNFSGLDMNVDFEKKENIILTVGRIGTLQKNNELLIKAFSKIYKSLPSWRLQFVGSVTGNFHDILNQYYKDYPRISDQVIVTGEIHDKVTLMNLYKAAKLFVLTSLWEGGTPNVIAEALYNGCCIVTADIDGAIDATDEERCGDIYEQNDAEALANLLLKRCNDPQYLLNAGQHAVAYARDKMNFEKNMARLYYLLYGEV